LSGFNIHGGLSMSPEFAALLIGLAVNASASIGETVRGAILAIPRGQWEAASAVGLKPMQVMRLVVLPQALRIVIPVLASSWLSLTKNSSLAVAIGFPDVVSILNTTANVTGQALEVIVLMMAIYLTLSLAVSVASNGWNRHFEARAHR
jgi:general L-amino acid transport system permease protein